MSAVDEKNIAFWNELCGTLLATQLGIKDSSAASLKRGLDLYIKCIK